MPTAMQPRKGTPASTINGHAFTRPTAPSGWVFAFFKKGAQSPCRANFCRENTFVLCFIEKKEKTLASEDKAERQRRTGTVWGWRKS